MSCIYLRVKCVFITLICYIFLPAYTSLYFQCIQFLVLALFVVTLGATDLLLVDLVVSRRFTRYDFAAVGATLLLAAAGALTGLAATGFFTTAGATDALLADFLTAGTGAGAFFTSLTGGEGLAGAVCLEGRVSLAGLDLFLVERATAGLAAGAALATTLSLAFASRLRSATGSTTVAFLLGRTL